MKILVVSVETGSAHVNRAGLSRRVSGFEQVLPRDDARRASHDDHDLGHRPNSFAHAARSSHHGHSRQSLGRPTDRPPAAHVSARADKYAPQDWPEGSAESMRRRAFPLPVFFLITSSFFAAHSTTVRDIG